MILVDLQNDFLHPDFLLGKTRADFTTTHPHLLSSLHSSVISFRRRQLPIIWIRSEYLATDNPLPPKHLTRPDGDKYLNVPLNGAHLAGSHYGSKQFCHPGSPGAEFHPDIQRLVRPNDTVITKTYYSGFTGTVLHQTLQTLNVDTLFFGGVTTTTCVRATVTDAFFHDYSINVIKSAVAPTSSTAGASALEVISTHYGSLIHHRDLDEALFDSALPTLYYVNGSIPSWRVQLLLAEKRIAYNPRRLRVMTNPKETRLPAFAAINPRCKTPTLVDSDGTIVIESSSPSPSCSTSTHTTLTHSCRVQTTRRNTQSAFSVCRKAKIYIMSVKDSSISSWRITLRMSGRSWSPSRVPCEN